GGPHQGHHRRHDGRADAGRRGAPPAAQVRGGRRRRRDRHGGVRQPDPRRPRLPAQAGGGGEVRMKILRIAWRSIWRNRRRTLISMSAATFGLVLVIFYSSLMSAMIGDAKNQLDTTGMGHVEVYAAGYRQKPQASKAFRDPAAVLAKLQLPPGAEAGYRVLARALISSAHASEGVEVHGVDWANEEHLASYVSDLRAGAAPAADDAQGILVGEKLAQRLKVGVGSKVRAMASRTDGEVGANLFRVRGIFHSISPALS